MQKLFTKPWLMEGWIDDWDVDTTSEVKRVKLTEADETAAKSAEAANNTSNQSNDLDDETVKAMYTTLADTMDYTAFVNLLSADVKSKAFVDYLKNHYKQLKTVKVASAKNVSIAVTALQPTQSEIDIDKSLAYPLTNVDSAKADLAGKDVVVNTPIITYAGKYIIDGHHRWSQLYAMNKEATIKAVNFDAVDGVTWSDMLKAMQIAIAAVTGEVKSQTVEGTNLIGINSNTVTKYVKDHITQEVQAVFKEMKQLDSVDKIAAYIVDNITSMNKTSKPVEGAPNRGVMPQTDATSVKAVVGNGIVDTTEALDTNEGIFSRKPELSQYEKDLDKLIKSIPHYAAGLAVQRGGDGYFGDTQGFIDGNRWGVSKDDSYDNRNPVYRVYVTIFGERLTDHASSPKEALELVATAFKHRIKEARRRAGLDKERF